jgi:E3 ubiquitin-protein ligase BRE1
MRYTGDISVLRQRCAFCFSPTRRKVTNWCPKCTVLRSELELTRASLKDCLAQRDRYHSDLATAEMRLDRLQSRTVQATHVRARSPPKEATVKDEEGVEDKEGDPKEEQRMSSSPAVSG